MEKSWYERGAYCRIHVEYLRAAGKRVQEAFVQFLRQIFDDDLDAMNAQFGLDYWKQTRQRYY